MLLVNAFDVTLVPSDKANSLAFSMCHAPLGHNSMEYKSVKLHFIINVTGKRALFIVPAYYNYVAKTASL